MTYKKTFYIAVNPVGSKFAKALQQAIKQKIANKVFRVHPARVAEKARRLARKFFSVTQNPLNKIEQFQRFHDRGVSHPQFARDENAARVLACKTLFARTLVNSTNGRGIVEFDRDVAVYPRAPLYTEYIPKKAEYRFHVFNGEVIDIQQKKKKRGFENERDTRIRNLANGYIYCRDGVNPPAGAADLAVRAVEACGYLYGAVDLIYNERRNQSYVLEVNSRPGLMGTTLEKYADAIIKTFDLDVQ